MLGPVKIGAKTTWAALLGLGLIYEIYTLANRRQRDTLSNLVWEGTDASPLVPLVIGVIVGHWFWPRKDV
jgi:hypothetical protein